MNAPMHPSYQTMGPAEREYLSVSDHAALFAALRSAPPVVVFSAIALFYDGLAANLETAGRRDAAAVALVARNGTETVISLLKETAQANHAESELLLAQLKASVARAKGAAA